MATRGRTLEERFWAKVDKTADCWEWTGARNTSGYGSFRSNGKTLTAHRVAHWLATGETNSGMELDHMCHNKWCVNPQHLRVVDRSANRQNLTGAYRNSKSGVRGVYWNPSPAGRGGRWVATGYIDGDQKFLKSFTDLEDAKRFITQWRHDHYPYSIKDQAPLRRGLSTTQGE